MKIRSSFKDYYDIGMGLGFDDNLDYIRTEREVILNIPGCKDEHPGDKETRKLAKALPGTSNPLDSLYYSVNSQLRIIGFCGKFYPVVTLTKGSHITLGKPVHCYSVEDIDKYVEQTLPKKEQERWLSRQSSRNAYLRMMEKYKGLESSEAFIVNHSPIVVMFEGRVRDVYEKPRWVSTAVWNARLKDYSFYRVMDPYLAFQAIEMFLGNLASPEKTIPPRTDKEKIESHGHDVKLSFRKGKKECK